MKPLKVEFQAFGPYAGHEIVDFSALSLNGLFLICGKTGIGKTTILDALTFALYGKSSGHARDDFSSMRCTNADFAVSTFVKLEFSSNGKEYLFERRLDRKRKNLSPEYSAMQKDENGVWEPLFENAKEKMLNDKAVEIVGLEYEQFRQVIVLPQGQFEKFLTSNADEKEKILVSIFGEDMWNIIARNFYDEASERLNMLERIEEGINTRLEEEGCKSIQELKDIIKDKETALSALEEENKKADYDSIINEQNKKLELVQKFTELYEAENKLKKYEDNKEQYGLWKKQDEGASKAEKVRPFIVTVDDSTKNLALRQQAEKDAKSSEAECSEIAEKALQALEEHKQSEEEIKSKTELKISYENRRTEYEEIDSARADFEAKSALEKKTRKEEEKAQNNYDAFAPKIKGQSDAYNELEKTHQDMLKSYISGITGELARDLKDGDKCPVCGSTTHPHKAEITDGSVTKEQVDAKKNAVDIAYKQLQILMNEQQKAQSELSEKKTIVSSATSAVSAAESKYEGLIGRLIEGIESLSELNTKINELEAKINEYNKMQGELEDAYKMANEAFASAKTLTESAVKEAKIADEKLQSDKKLLETELQKHGFLSEEDVRGAILDDNEHEALKKNISDYEFNYKKTKYFINELNEELSGKNEPDKVECEEIINNANNAKQAYAAEYGKLNGEMGRLKDKVRELEKESKGLDEKLLEARQDCTFARKLRGDTGTGLQRYVLGIMFSSVVAAANKMLEMVHGGRYRLFRSDDKAQGSNKRGLELKVYDKYSEDSEGRFVSTLSGGEKFLVSLALSIGMSTIAQKSGIKIEALFIDEGFGSLDEESISDAMNILNTIQSSNGIVGIISHVQLLQERIPTKLVVERTEKGSHILQTVG